MIRLSRGQDVLDAPRKRIWILQGSRPARRSAGGCPTSLRTHQGVAFLMKMLAICLLLLATSSWSPLTAATKPNIVFILADDLGYGDLGCYGQTKIKTPNIDRLAADGMRFTNFYAGCSVCAPSRCTLLTGKHLGHATVRDNLQRGPGLEGQHPMEPGTVTVAQLLKKAGYATAIVGKWGLGMPEDHSSPPEFGFDHHYGYLCQGMAHTYYPPYLWRDNTPEPLAGNPSYSYGTANRA